MNCMLCKNYIKNHGRCSLKLHEPFTNGIKVNDETVVEGKKFDHNTQKYVECDDFEEYSKMNIFDFWRDKKRLISNTQFMIKRIILSW